MKALEQKILSEGKLMPGNILNVGGFLNQQLDCSFLMEMGSEISRLYSDCGINKILTIEASGIAIAVAAGVIMNVPVVFAKKHRSGNVAGEVYFASIHSYTHGNDYTAVVPAKYFSHDDKVLVIDDFLASGEALVGLVDIVKQSGAQLVGAAVAIEKGFQGGGDTLRKKGIRIESLALIDRFENDTVVFRKDVCN